MRLIVILEVMVPILKSIPQVKKLALLDFLFEIEMESNKVQEW